MLYIYSNYFIKIALAFSFLAIPLKVYAEVNFLIFPEIRLDYNNDHSFSSDNITPSVDIFAAGNLGFINILAEGYISEDLQHIERLQIGFNVTESSRIWFGRHHNPFGYWHTQYHHGTFLQTSISRPSMVELGAAGGIVPSHSTGVLFEGEIEQRTSAWHYALSIGLTSQLDSSAAGHHGGDSTASLHDFDIFNPEPNDHELGYAFRLAYLPDALEETQIGGFITREEIVLKPSPHLLSEGMHEEESSTENEIITLDVVGVFLNFQHLDFHLITEAYYLTSKVPTEMLVQTSSFSAAYLQIEYAVNEYWTPYMRVDRSFSYINDPYLQLLDGYPVNANTIGIRLDLPGNNAIKLEYSKRDFTHENTDLWLMNWSAAW
ncbi:MAG: hypothetical protein MJK12_20325 [Colwellia sp.]|nr:hypothetical protein [Colwellia sp.]